MTAQLLILDVTCSPSTISEACAVFMFCMIEHVHKLNTVPAGISKHSIPLRTLLACTKDQSSTAPPCDENKATGLAAGALVLLV